MEGLLEERAFVTSAEAAALLGAESRTAADHLEAAAAALAAQGAQTLYTVVEGTHRITLCCGRETADKLQEATEASRVNVFAAVLPGTRAAAALEGKRPPFVPCLRPRAGVTQRSYPLVSREALEKEARTGIPAMPMVAPAPASKAEPTSVKKEPVAASPLAAAVAIPKPAAPATDAACEAQKEMPPVPVAPVTTGAPATDTVTAPPAPLPIAKETTAGSAAPLPEKKQASLFDMMRTASAKVAQQDVSAQTLSGQKRSRGDKAMEGATGTSKKSNTASQEQAPKPKATRKPKAPKTEPGAVATKSLAKLAKASAKNRKDGTSAPVKAHTSMPGLLDEEEESRDSRESASRATSVRDNSVLPMEPQASAEASVLDVTETLANDDIIICDDAPPLAFLAPSHLKTIPAAGPSSSATGPVSSAQSTLGAFFNPEVVKFQKSYVRKLKTEMKKDANGEYNCVDVPYYEPVSGSGECLSEEAYHRRTAEIARRHQQQDSTPSRSSDEGGKAGTDNSPEAAASQPQPESASAAKVAKQGARPLVAKVAPEEKPVSKPKTLMSFFKSSS